MTLQDFKDQVAREQYCDNWKVFHMNCIIQGEFPRMDDANDRAAELHAKAREEEAKNWTPLTEDEIYKFIYNNSSGYHNEHRDSCEEIASIISENFEVKRKSGI